MLRGQSIVEVDGQKARSSEAHAHLAKAFRAAERPPAPVQVENDWKWRSTTRHSDIGVEAATQADLLMKGADDRESAIEFLGMAFPRVSGGGDVDRRVPVGERTQDRSVMSRHG